MVELTILINQLSDVKNVVEAFSKCKGEVSVYSGRYIVDGKSLMGLFSLDLSKPIKVEIDGVIPVETREMITPYVIGR